jgi:dihydropteroate synthase
MIRVLASVRPAISLRNVRWHRHRRAPDLARESVGFLSRKPARDSVGLKRQLNSVIIKTLHDSLPTPESIPRPLPRWRVRGRDIPIAKPLVLGILNVTPDSFSDGGRFEELEPAVAQARQMVEEGADAIDVGGESTRPQGAEPVSADEELRRVIPVITALRKAFPDMLVSIDTTKSEVARAALDVGANVINDVSGFRIDPRVGEIAASTGAGVVLMHSRGGVAEMGTYRYAHYGDDVVGDVVAELHASVQSALSAGIARESVVVDPGIGFAKRSEHSLRVLAELERVGALGFPVMVGVSRKRFVGELSGVELAADRLAGTVGANVAALMRGARLFRVHDVAQNRQALDVAWAIMQVGGTNRDRESDLEASDSRFPIPDSR